MNFKKICFFVIVTRLFDGLTTFYATPDLKYELNPIVRMFDLGWLGFLFLGVIFTALVIIMSYKSFQRLGLFNIKSNSFKEYCSFFFFDKNIRYFEMTYVLPLKKRFFVFIGQVFPLVLIYYSFFLIINNTFIIGTYHVSFLNDFFLKIYKIHGLIVSVVPVVIFFLVSFLYLRKSYKIYN